MKGMKYYKLPLLLVAVFLLSFVSCSDDGELKGLFASSSETEPFLKISSDSLEYEAGDYKTEVSAQKVKVSCNTGWAFDNVPEWIEVTPMSGTGDTIVSIKPKIWDKLESRKWTLQINADRLRDSIVLLQTRFKPYIDVQRRLDFKESSDTTFTLKCNTKWTIEYLEGDWYEITPLTGEGDCNIKVTNLSNNLWDEESGSINCYLNNYNGQENHRTMKLIRKSTYKLDIAENQRDHEVSKNGGIASFYIDSNVRWKMSPSGDISNWMTIVVNEREIIDFSRDITGDTSATIRISIDSLKKNQENVDSYLFVTCDNDSLNYPREPIKVVIKQNP